MSKSIDIRVPDIGESESVELIEILVDAGDTVSAEPVSYTHLTLPTIYSV